MWRVFALCGVFVASIFSVVSAQATEDSSGKALPPGWINAKDFGAVGDGKTDDTAALQKAIDGAWTGGDFSPRLYNPRFGPGASPEGQNRYWSGVVYVPSGVYKTSEPLRLHGYSAIIGDATRKPIIISSAKAAMVSWEGQWDEGEVDWESSGKWHVGSDSEHKETGAKWCCNVVLKNLDIRGAEYGYHTLRGDSSIAHRGNPCVATFPRT